MAYIGVSPSNGVRRVHTYTATASQTTFSGAGAEGTSLSYKDSNFVDVYQNGIKLGDADYTSTSGTSIVLAQGASVDDLVVVVVFDVFSIADTVSKADGGTFDGNVTMGGTLDVTGATTLTGGVSGNTTFSGEIITSTSGTANFRAGNNAGDAIASGSVRNVVVGDEAGTAITTGTRNVAVGYQALATEDTGSRSIAIGHQALTTQDGGTNDIYNVAVGHNAGGAVTTGVQGVYIGGLAGDADTTGGKNTYVGYNAGTANAGDQNVFIGHSAGSAITDGDKSTIIGKNDGNSGGLDIRTADNQIVISEGDGNVRFYSNAASFIAIGLSSSTMFLVQDNRIATTDITGGTVDNTLANGWSNRRWTVVYAASGSINTSDENEKQDIEALSEKEKKVAVACKGLIKKYRWKDAVLKKGDNARIHVGIIAQDLKLAFEAEGLDASKYGMFCSDTWWEKEETINDKVVVKDFETEEEAPEGATKKTRLGVRYEELLAFIISAL